MTSSTQTICCGDRKVIIDLSDIQETPSELNTIINGLFRNKNIACDHLYPETVSNLSEKVSLISKTEEILEDTQKNSTKIKAFALLRTALFVTCIAGLIIACPFAANAGLLRLPLDGLLIMSALYLVYWFAFSKLHEILEQNTYHLSRALYAAKALKRSEENPLSTLPLWAYLTGVDVALAFTKENRVNRALIQQKENLERELKECQLKNDKLPPEFLQRRKQVQEVIEVLNQEIQERHKEIVELVGQKYPRDTTQLKDQVSNYEKARDELRKAFDFYQKYFPSIYPPQGS